MADKLCRSTKRLANTILPSPQQLCQMKLSRTPCANQSTLLTFKISDRQLSRRLLQQITWRQELSQEIKYWRMWFETKGDEWPDDYSRRLSPGTEFDENLRRFINLPAAEEIKFLDVGSGPVTGVGFVWPGRKLKIVAVDPLADIYNKLLAEFSLTPPIRTENCPAERLTAKFPNERFDLVHCRNALDHSYDPFSAIKQMLAVTRPGGTVVLDHYANEALHHSYTGLHQWNFDIQDERFVLWNRSSRIDLASELGDLVTIECQARKQGRTWVLAILRKKPEDKK